MVEHIVRVQDYGYTCESSVNIEELKETNRNLEVSVLHLKAQVAALEHDLKDISSWIGRHQGILIDVDNRLKLLEK